MIKDLIFLATLTFCAATQAWFSATVFFADLTRPPEWLLYPTAIWFGVLWTKAFG
jgi:hypothetical protein